jgi:hypothetical protein
MNLDNGHSWPILLILCLAVVLSACGSDPTPVPETPAPTAKAPEPDAPTAEAPTSTATPTLTPTWTPTPLPPPPATSTPTPTPTHAPLPAAPTATPEPASRCEGLAGQLEVQVLVGPADAVGLEPQAVGSVPFAVTTSQAPFLVEGQGPISYHDILVEEWGTYDVTMDMDLTVEGQCSGEAGSEQLDVTLEMVGEQLLVVDSPEFHGEYPWEGTHSLPLAFPLEQGATAQGEGWVIVLHLGSP